LGDLLAAAGIVMLSSGLWWLSPPLALVLIGTLLLGLGLLLAQRKAKK
jgi:hypothetical protein